MEKIKFFFDTYAFIEILKQNKNYLPYKNCKILTTKLNLMELHYSILKNVGKEQADKIYEQLLKFAIEIPDEIIKKANQFKYLHKKQKLSYIDSIGYVLAKVKNIKFLTGDKEFQNFPNVEFVK